MGRKRRFIDKEKSVTFHLLHRSQRDPLTADESAPQRVLAEVGGATAAAGTNEPLSRQEQQAKYGIYFDDDYNYLQHLKESNKSEVLWVEAAPARKAARPGMGAADDGSAMSSSSAPVPSLQLPSSVFRSHVEEGVGLLNKAAVDYSPPDDIEAELMEVMDDEYENDDPEGQLEDDFVTLAGGVASDEEEDEAEIEVEVDNDGDDKSDVSSNGYDEVPGLKDFDSKSRFTEYSTTSRGVLSTVEMETMNERFEHFMEQYDDMEMGGLESEEIVGCLDPNSSRLIQLAEEFEKEKAKPPVEKDVSTAAVDEESDEEDLVLLTVYEDVRENRVDCESIISSYSNQRNLPKVIDEPSRPARIRLNKKGLVVDEKPRLTRKALAQLAEGERETDSASDRTDSDSEAAASSLGQETLVSRISMLSVRHPGETGEERKARKRELKALRRERIQERKANQQLAKELASRQAQSHTDKLKAKQAIKYQ